MQCIQCNRFGHVARDCRVGNSNNNNNKKSFLAKTPDSMRSSNDFNEELDDEDEKADYVCAYVSLIAAKVNNYNNNLFKWIIDSGASRHMCGNRDLFISMRASSVKTILVANKNNLHVSEEGDVCLNSVNNDKILLKGILYVPHIAANLL